MGSSLQWALSVRTGEEMKTACRLCCLCCMALRSEQELVRGVSIEGTGLSMQLLEL